MSSEKWVMATKKSRSLQGNSFDMVSFFENLFGGSGVGSREFLEACRARRGFLDGQLLWLRNEKQQYAEESKKLNQALERIRQETIGYLLPEVKTTFLQQLEKKLRYPGLLQIKEQYEEKFRKAEVRRSELEAMDEIQHFDYQMNLVEDAIQDLKPRFESQSKRYRVWTQNIHFKKLQERTFFELDNRPSWWRQVLDWRSVSLLMGQLAKEGIQLKTPTEVKNEFRFLRDQYVEIANAYKRRVAERDKLTHLKQELKAVKAAPERLLAELYHRLGEAVLEHLKSCPEDLRIELAKNDPYLDTFFRKEAGTRKQGDYLRELSVVRLEEQTQQVEQEVSKLNTKIRTLNLKIARGKWKRYTKEQLDQMQDFKRDKWDKRRSHAAEVRNRITGFDSYDHGSFVTQYLWWDLITGGLDGNDLFEVRQFREQNPNWRSKDYVDPIHGIAESSPLDDAADSLASEMTLPAELLSQDAS